MSAAPSRQAAELAVPENLRRWGFAGQFLSMRIRGLRLLPLLLTLVPLAAGACASAARVAPPVEAPAASVATPSTAPAIAAPDHVVARSALNAVVSEGLGMFLRRVDLDDHPVLVGGKFHGFRIAGLRDPQFWSGVDLKPGDVVTSVNGFPIEHPEQAQTAFESLEVASELRVAVEREGQPRELVYPIVDDR
jgi:S1-C subfamily serine protease